MDRLSAASWAGCPVPLVGPHRINLAARDVDLGRSGVRVSRLCFGLGSSGCGTDSMQGHLAIDLVASFLEAGTRRHVTWWDTSDDYGSHPHVAEAVRRVGREKVQITSKTHAGTARSVRDSVSRTLDELAVGYVDILLLHEVDSLSALQARREGLQELHRLREAGWVRAVGLSTHSIDVLEASVGDRALQVLLTNFNFAGVHMDAPIADYERALRAAHEAGQGVALMKTLGEGVLAPQLDRALRHNLEQEFVHGVLVGVVSQEQAEAAACIWDRVCAAPDDAEGLLRDG